MQRTKVWDIPTRLFHWLLVSSFIAQYITAELMDDAMQWHFYFGYFTLGLILFRIVWGLFGSQYARFSSFLFSPRKTLTYLRSLPSKHAQAYPGHNPAGGLFVLVMLALIAIQAISGLFMTDDVFLDGPYRYAVEEETLELMNLLHHDIFWYIVGLILLHISAVLFYTLYKGQALIKAMFTGDKEIESSGIKSSKVLLALSLALLCALAVYYLVVVLPEPPAVESLYF